MVNPLELTPEQRDRLVEEISKALEQVMDRSCAEMGPLWIDATRSQRGPIGAVHELPFQASAKYLALSKGSRSKYRQLAAWRHAVLWQGALGSVDDADFRAAVEVVYFTPYPPNAPPYAWSQAAESAPGVERFGGAKTLKSWACEGAWHTVASLRRQVRALEADGSWHLEVRAGLVRTGCRDTLADVLKLEELDPWEDV